MSALFPCPHCGKRPVQEFRYGAEAPAARPEAEAPMDEAALASWLYDADNPRGSAMEWWQHAAGCRLWFALERDTVRDTASDRAGEGA